MILRRVILLVLALAAVFTGAVSPLRAGSIIETSITHVQLNPDNPQDQKIGKLAFRGGLIIKSPHSRFGGLSSLSLSADRQRLVTISDKGARFDARITYDRQGRLDGVKEVAYSELSGTDGRILQEKYLSDAESIAIGGAGEMIVSFERNHRMLVYGKSDVKKFTQPKGLSDAPKNGGIEALTHLSHGRLLAITEKMEADETDNFSRGWIWQNNSWLELKLDRQGDYRASGAATAPNGEVYILLTKFEFGSGNVARIVRLNQIEIRAGATLKGEIVGELKSPHLVDNFEGIDVKSDGAGRSYLYLMSDDNFNPLQDTLFYMFEITG